MRMFIAFLFALLFISCQSQKEKVVEIVKSETAYIKVLGIAQDAGYPQIACNKSCCKDLWDNESLRKMVSCIGLVEPKKDEYWIFDATPDFKDQIAECQEANVLKMPAGIFLTHGHMGHYTGLIHLGREAYGAKGVPVYAMPRMQEFLKSNGPWDQLVSLNNIALTNINHKEEVVLGTDLKVVPLLVPHRDEYSETVGYKIFGPKRSVLFIPDIDKWKLWDLDILEQIREVDIALLDGSFFENGEIPNRDMSQIPHPFVEESMSLFSALASDDKSKVHFIHFNHTNPLLKEGSPAFSKVLSNGFNIAQEGQVFSL